MLLFFTISPRFFKPFILNPGYVAVFQNKTIRSHLPLRLASPDSVQHHSQLLYHLRPFLTFSSLPSLPGALHVCPGPVHSCVIMQSPALSCTLLCSLSVVVSRFSLGQALAKEGQAQPRSLGFPGNQVSDF